VARVVESLQFVAVKSVLAIAQRVQSYADNGEEQEDGQVRTKKRRGPLSHCYAPFRFPRRLVFRDLGSVTELSWFCSSEFLRCP
jgi:hypothetical protein